MSDMLSDLPLSSSPVATSYDSGGGKGTTGTGSISSTFETALTSLQPIRDLAKNWDIDIAACLDEYLQDLELSLTQETRQHVLSSLNFAQAAIVLQNSSGIYSRKVDFLHSYVYKVQQELSVHDGNPGNGLKAGGRKSASGLDTDIEAFLNYDPNQDFLLLDDVLPIDTTEDGAKINLQLIDTPLGSSDIANESYADNHNNNDRYLNASTATNRFSMANMSTNRRASWDTGSSSLLDQSMVRTNMAAQRTMFATLDTGNLHLVGGACDIGSDGVLRIPGSSLFETNPIVETMEIFNDGFHTDRDVTDVDRHDDNTCFDGDGIDDHDEGVGFLLVHTTGNNNGGNASMSTTPQVAANDSTTGLDKRVKFAAELPSSIQVSEARKPKVDYWAMLDPYTHDDKPERPLRIGKTLVLPEGIDKLPSQYTPGSLGSGALLRHNQERRQRSHQGYMSRITETFRATLGKRTFDSRSQSVSGLAFGNEFAYVAKETAKRKSEERRALQRQQMLERIGPDPILEELVAADDNQNNEIFGSDSGGGDYDDGDDNDTYDNATDRGIDNSNTGIVAGNNVYNDCVVAAESDTDGEAKTFEELCRAHVQAFARGAEKYAAETKLSARVEQWQAKLLPRLDDEDQRPEFDIHQYSIDVVHAMEKSLTRHGSKMDVSGVTKASKDHAVEFREITRNCPQYDVCRTFLAALSLTNSGNVQFAASSSLESLQIELLNSDIERPIEAYFMQEST